MALQSTFKCSVDDSDWDPELAMESSPTELCGGEVLDIDMRGKLLESFECFDEIISWDEWISEPVVNAEAAAVQETKSVQVPNIILEMLIGRRRSVLRDEIVFDGMAVREVEIGKIKKRRYVKRGGGTRRHGRPPGLTFVGSFGNDG